MKDKMQNKMPNCKLMQFKYSFTIKTLSKLGITETDFNIMKPTWNKSTGNMMLNEEQNVFPKDQEPGKVPNLTISFWHHTESPSPNY